MMPTLEGNVQSLGSEQAEKDYSGRISDFERDWRQPPDQGTQNILDDLREHDKPVLSTETACG